MARLHSHIPVGVVKWLIQHRKEAIGWTLVKIMAFDGKRLHTDRYNRKHLKQLMDLNLVGWHPPTGIFWARSWEEIMRVLGIQELTFVTITHKTLVKYSFKDLAYSVGLQYMFRLQEDGRKPNGKPSKRGKQLHPSVHLGGIAHSLMAAFFGRSSHWSQIRRKSCHARRLIRFKRRRLPASELDPKDVPDTDVPYRAFDITSECNVRVQFDFFIPRRLRWKLERSCFCPKEGVRVYYRIG